MSPTFFHCSINGIPACANKELLTDIARKEWGFQGYIVSDDGAIPDIVSQHHYMKTDVEATAAAIGAGCNLELVSTVYRNIPDAIRQGLLTGTMTW